MEELVTKNDKNSKLFAYIEQETGVGKGGQTNWSWWCQKNWYQKSFNEKMKTTGPRGEGELVYWAQSVWTQSFASLFFALTHSFD